MLVSMKKLLEEAYKHNYAIGAFNVNNMEILESIVDAAENQKSPVIISTSEGAIKYAGLKMIYSMIKTIAEQSKVPIALHLDHGRNLNLIKKCIKIGYTSVMIDGSHYKFKKNINITKKVVSIAHKNNVAVEGELGTIGGAEDSVSSRKIIYTEPLVAKEFVKKTGIDALAVAIGTSHGAYKFEGESKLDILRLKKINSLLKMPLVLHGASCVSKNLVNKAEKYGAQLGRPSGIPDSQIRLAIKNGISKINTDTDLRLAFDAGLREIISLKPKEFDPRQLLSSAKKEVEKVVEHRIKLFGSAKKIN